MYLVYVSFYGVNDLILCQPAAVWGYIRGKSLQTFLVHSEFCGLGVWVCHQPHETAGTLGSLTYPPRCHSFFRPSWPVAVCLISDSVCAHLCFNKDSETLYGFFPLYIFHLHQMHPLRDPPNSTPPLSFSNCEHSPADIWISTADRYMVTAPAFIILQREVASSVAINDRHPRSYCNRHVMNGQIVPLSSFHFSFDKKKTMLIFKHTTALNSQRGATTILRVPFPDIVFIKTNEHFGIGCCVKIFHRRAAKPQWDACEESR